MCFECHLPISDVRANQRLARKRPRRWLLFILALLVLVPAIWFTIGARSDRQMGLGDGAAERGGRSRGIAHSALEVGDRDGHFVGTIRLDNYTDLHADVLVTVHVYDQDQDIGELSGNISLKPHTHADATLDSSDPFRPFTDTVVEIVPLPEAVS